MMMINDRFIGDYDNGFLILNQGGSGQASVSYISNDLMLLLKMIYTAVNGTDLLGKYVQIFFLMETKLILLKEAIKLKL